MSMDADTEAAIAANKRRYDDLKRAGQTHAPRALPGPSPRPLAPLADASVLHRETIPGGWYWSTVVKRGEAMRVATPEGPASVALVAWALADTSERLNYADTVKIQWTTALGKGRVLFSDMGRVMLSLIEDTCGAHDCIAGGSTPASVKKAGGNVPRRNTRDNFLLAAGKLGLSRRDVPPCVSFFAPVRTGLSDGSACAWDAERPSTGRRLPWTCRAEMDLERGACRTARHPLDPDQGEPPAVDGDRGSKLPPAAARRPLPHRDRRRPFAGSRTTDAVLVLRMEPQP